MARLVGDDFAVTVIVESNPSITIFGEFQPITTLPGRTVFLGFYYDGGTGSGRGTGFALAWGESTPPGWTDPTLVDFVPAVPLEGQPTPSGSIAPGELMNNIYRRGNDYYHTGHFRATMPTGQTETITYNGEVQITD